jgi:hypothetical protein
MAGSDAKTFTFDVPNRTTGALSRYGGKLRYTSDTAGVWQKQYTVTGDVRRLWECIGGTVVCKNVNDIEKMHGYNKCDVTLELSGYTVTIQGVEIEA